MKLFAAALAVLSIAAFAGTANADSIDLKDGRHLHGKFVGGTEGVIAFSVEGATGYYSVKDVLTLAFSDEEENSSDHFQQSSSPITLQEGSLSLEDTRPRRAHAPRVASRMAPGTK